MSSQGIYEQHWWRYYMFTINILASHLVAKTWFVRMNKYLYGVTRFITFYFVIFLMGKQFYYVGWVNNLYQNSTLFSVTWDNVLSLIFAFFIWCTKRLYLKFVSLLVFFVVDAILVNMHILVFQNGWNFFFTMIVCTISILVLIVIERYALKEIPERFQKKEE
ncbi:MAG: hypothetical protein ACD_26C00150G0001 [uncultured bacterium]|nr:MAG: hypothetical protein ACD_26C00150G0001 [uncultured bacterium]